MSAPFPHAFLGRQPYCDFDARFLRALEQCAAWPQPEQYDALAACVPPPRGVPLPRFVSEKREQVRSVGGYEQHVAQLGAVPTRPEHFHDFFNMAVWAHFPRLRWALNSLHVDPHAGPIDPRNGRAPAQNLAATLDESGLLVLSTSRSVFEELRELRFKRAFWERRAEVQATTRFWVVGHGLLESLLNPRPGFVARSLQLLVPTLPAASDASELRLEIDARVATAVHGFRTARPILHPVPVLAIPGFSENDSAAFYEDAQNIRFEPISRLPKRDSAFELE